MIKCVIFDCDGLMFDSEKISIEVWKRIGKKYGFNFDEEFFTGITGSGKGQAKKQFDRYPGISDILPDERLDIKFKILDENTRIIKLTPHGQKYEDIVNYVI